MGEGHSPPFLPPPSPRQHPPPLEQLLLQLLGGKVGLPEPSPGLPNTPSGLPEPPPGLPDTPPGLPAPSLGRPAAPGTPSGATGQRPVPPTTPFPGNGATGPPLGATGPPPGATGPSPSPSPGPLYPVTGPRDPPPPLGCGTGTPRFRSAPPPPVTVRGRLIFPPIPIAPPTCSSRTHFRLPRASASGRYSPPSPLLLLVGERGESAASDWQSPALRPPPAGYKRRCAAPRRHFVAEVRTVVEGGAGGSGGILPFLAGPGGAVPGSVMAGGRAATGAKSSVPAGPLRRSYPHVPGQPVRLYREAPVEAALPPS